MRHLPTVDLIIFYLLYESVYVCVCVCVCFGGAANEENQIGATSMIRC